VKTEPLAVDNLQFRDMLVFRFGKAAGKSAAFRFLYAFGNSNRGNTEN
jgi:hypothetical protein